MKKEQTESKKIRSLIFKIFIASLIFIVAGKSYAHSLNLSFRKDPKNTIIHAVRDVRKEYINTNSLFIPDLDHKKIVENIIDDGIFSSYADFNILNNTNSSNYFIKRNFKKNYLQKKSQADISIQINNKRPVELNSIIEDNKAYVNIPNVYTKTLEIDLQNFGKKLLDSSILTQEQKDDLSEKETQTLENMSINLFEYPGTIGEIKDYYLSFVKYNIDEILYPDNIEVSDVSSEIKKTLNDPDIKNYKLKISFFDYKYFLLSSNNAFENLLNIYSANYNLNLDKELIHSELRDLSEETLEKYDKKGTIDANFYINKKGQLRGVVLETEENKEEGIEKEPILNLALTGEKNTTDNIYLSINNVLNRNLEYKRVLNTEKNTLSSSCTLSNSSNLSSQKIEDISVYNKDSKNLKYNLVNISSDSEKSFNLSFDGTFENTDKIGYTFNVANLIYKSSGADLNIKGHTSLNLETPELKAPENFVDIFTLNNSEFKNIKEKTINSINKYILIDDFKCRIPTWNIYKKFNLW